VLARLTDCKKAAGGPGFWQFPRLLAVVHRVGIHYKPSLERSRFPYSFPSPALAVDNGAGQVPDLKETLDKGLKARLPSEFAFLRRVVEEVDNKRLPRKMVLGTFQWARRQSDEMPFPYFQFALRLQAKKVGVQL